MVREGRLGMVENSKEVVSEKGISEWILMNDKSKAFITRYNKHRVEQPERQRDYCPICKKLRKEWEQTSDVHHAQLHALLLISFYGSNSNMGINNPDFKRWTMQAGGLE